MKSLVTSRAMAAGLALGAVYFTLAELAPMPVVFDILNGAFLGVAFLVAVVYSPTFWLSVRRVGDRASLLAIGVGLVWASYLGNRMLSAYYRGIDRLDLLTNHKMIGLFILMALIGGILHVVAPGYPAESLQEKFGGRYRWLIVASIALGILGVFWFKAV
jgi:hypothetical protein